jgi:hypothetical protein
MMAEMRRGIWETTGLYSEPGEPGWIAITCEARAMAEWLGTAIAPENVEVRVDDDRVLLPAGPRFRLEHEVKSVITVVAKTHHYGTMHGGMPAWTARSGAAPNRRGFRCVPCGLDFQVSRPGTGLASHATCPVDGTAMIDQGLVDPHRSGSFRHAHGPGEPYHSHETYRPGEPKPADSDIPGPIRIGVGGSGAARSALIDALRRRYGRRRAVVVSGDGALEATDPAVDLILAEWGEESRGSDVGPQVVDASIGVLSASAVAQALDHDEGALRGWRLLVISTAEERPMELARIENDTRRRRGQDPVVLVDLTTGQGIDDVVSWLHKELLLEPWRARGPRVTPRAKYRSTT